MSDLTRSPIRNEMTRARRCPVRDVGHARQASQGTGPQRWESNQWVMEMAGLQGRIVIVYKGGFFNKVCDYKSDYLIWSGWLIMNGYEWLLLVSHRKFLVNGCCGCVVT